MTMRPLNDEPGGVPLTLLVASFGKSWQHRRLRQVQSKVERGPTATGTLPASVV